MPSRFMMVVVGLVITASFATAQPKRKNPAPKAPADATALKVPNVTPVYAPAMVFLALDDRMAYSKLSPAVYVPNLCHYRYRVSTGNPDCQKFVDQALGYLYSYVWIEAARSAETALKHDPECAMAWMTLSRGLEKWGRGDWQGAMKKAQELLPKASHRESYLINARLQEKGLTGSATGDDRKKAAARTLDEMLMIYDDDEEGWFSRGLVVSNWQGGSVESVPFYKALLRINPIHPGANHELVHYYEGARRPVLGWPNATGYMDSSPGLPHAFHMQAHLAMRIGKWEKTTDWSDRAIVLQREYHRAQGVKHHEDHQFSHHLETLTLSLVHDGRFREVTDIQKECDKYGYSFTAPWFRTALLTHNWDSAKALIEKQRKSDKTLAAYFSAMMYVESGETAKIPPELDVLKQAIQNKKNDRRLEQRFNEVQGRYLCLTGAGTEGLKLLQRNVDKTKDDYYYHAWGGGAGAMEAWGVAALDAGNAVTAEEAFLEALAHDAGSFRGALGMQMLCERLGRAQEAARFATLARKQWAKADPLDYERQQIDMAKRAESIKKPATTSAAGSD